MLSANFFTLFILLYLKGLNESIEICNDHDIIVVIDIAKKIFFLFAIVLIAI